jgi:hypothetical protein
MVPGTKREGGGRREYWLNIPFSKTSGVMIKLKLKSEKLKRKIRLLDISTLRIPYLYKSVDRNGV